ncbi:MAG: DNA mismatch repair endonuclease MutL [Lachnospiraceae bacterium]|nr:DNA mismatch repair endonuclease MutL [Lachnospiraceae bacterium]
MAKIALLDQHTIDKIAAGEVIERPSSVVKELVENAIDAGATAVTVEIREGGISFLRVTDNGSGIEKEQVPLAFLRHSTSKIRRVEDLFQVSSLGFRGEALSSIAAIAMVELITKTAEAEAGVRCCMEGGVQKKLEETAAPDGTTFLVRSLFYNTPARRKFLKSPMTEAGYISDLMERMALSHPEVSFQFINNGQTKLHTSGNHNLKDVIYHIYGREVAANLAEIHAVRGHVEITGFIGKPVISRGNRAYENYFINGRYIKSSLISRGIEDAYRTFLMQHKYPFTALHFAMDGQLLDVNVHPTKMELRFSNQEELYEFVRETVRQGLSGRELIPEVKLAQEMPRTKAVREKKAELAVPLAGAGFSPMPVLESPRQKPEQKQMSQGPQPKPVCASQERSLEYFLAQMQKRVTAEFQENVIRERGSYGEKEPKSVPAPAAKSPEEPKEEARQLELFETGLLNPASKSEIRMIGQLFETYWLVQFEDKFYMIDQHAAHEKVLYERTVKELETKEITSQMVSPPLVLTLTMQEAQRLEEYRDCFLRLGFEIEPFGGRDYAVSAVPGNLFGIAEKDLFLEVLGGLDQAGSRDSGLVLERIASMSCKAAVKGCQRMSTAEAYALIEELLTLENPYNCPHGRPTIISMTKQEIEKKFKRIV